MPTLLKSHYNIDLSPGFEIFRNLGIEMNLDPNSRGFHAILHMESCDEHNCIQFHAQKHYIHVWNHMEKITENIST